MVANAETRNTQPGEVTETESEVDAKQGTDKPRNMPIVLVVSTVGAAVAMWFIWATFFSPG